MLFRKEVYVKKKKTSAVRKARRKGEIFYHGMVLPGLVFVIIFDYIPMIGIIMAFQNYVPAKGLFGSKWVGLKHFRHLLKLPDIGEILRNTIYISLGKLLWTTLLSIAFAILLNEIRHKYFKKIVQTTVYLPHFFSWVILASIVRNLFSYDGLVNAMIQSMGGDPVNYLGSTAIFPNLMIGTHVWKEFGYSSIVFLAAITAVDPGLHEAAAIDGASWWQRTWHVTLPGMLPIIILNGAMGLTGILSAGFDQIYNLYSPIVYETADVLDTYVYRVGLIDRQYSFGSAVSLIRSIVGMVLLLSANWASKRFTDRKIF